MATYSTTIRTNTPPAQVWDRLGDFASVAEWDPGVRSAAKTTLGVVQVGTRYRVNLRLPIGGLPVHYQVRAFAPKHHLTVRAGSRLFCLEDSIDFRPSGSGTSVAYRAELKGRGVLRLIEPVLALLINGAGRRAEPSLAAWLDQLGQPEEVIDPAA